MKVLHVLRTSIFSGAENVACQIIDVFRNDMEMTYCSPNGPISRSLQDRQIPYLPMKKLNVSELKKIIRIYKPDIIHAHDYTASIISLLASSKTPVISHIHVNKPSMNRLSFHSLLYSLTIPFYSKIIMVSKSILDSHYFRSKIIGKDVIIHNMISKEKLYSKIENTGEIKEYDIVYVGRLTYQKNPERLIQIVDMTTKEMPDLKVAIVGDGELKESINQMVKRMQLKNVKLFGFLDNPYPILKKSKIMLMTSRTEGLPMVILESMLLGVPVVSTPVDGVKEVVENGFDGFYAEDNETLVSIIVNLLVDRDFYNKIRSETYSKALSLNNTDNYKSQIELIYSQVFNKCHNLV